MTSTLESGYGVLFDIRTMTPKEVARFEYINNRCKDLFVSDNSVEKRFYLLWIGESKNLLGNNDADIITHNSKDIFETIFIRTKKVDNESEFKNEVARYLQKSEYMCDIDNFDNCVKLDVGSRNFLAALVEDAMVGKWIVHAV